MLENEDSTKLKNELLFPICQLPSLFPCKALYFQPIVNQIACLFKAISDCYALIRIDWFEGDDLLELDCEFVLSQIKANQGDCV